MDRFAWTFSALALPIALWSTACFDDPQANETSSTNSTTASEGSGDESGDGSCPDGSAGCPCYGNETCDGDLECIDGVCKLPSCVPGSLNCDCYEGVCLAGLVCVEGTCKPEDAMPGCEAAANCDDNLCTQGDELCGEGMCVGGVEVQCPLGATCDPSSGSCACDAGTVACGNECIPDSQCCTDEDCSGDSICSEGSCTCEGGLVCNNECIADVVCCPGEVSANGCTCGAQKTCTPEGTWSSCAGGNPNPQCATGQSMPCGNCGTQNCTAQCNWTTCQGQGVCSPGSQNCTGEGKLEMCTQSCFWQHVGDC